MRFRSGRCEEWIQVAGWLTDFDFSSACGEIVRFICSDRSLVAYWMRCFWFIGLPVGSGVVSCGATWLDGAE